MGLLVDTDTWAQAGAGDTEHVSSSPPQRVFVIATLVNPHDGTTSKKRSKISNFLLLLVYFAPLGGDSPQEFHVTAIGVLSNTRDLGTIIHWRAKF